MKQILATAAVDLAVGLWLGTFCGIACACSFSGSVLPDTETVRIELPGTHPVWTLVAPGKKPSYTIRWYDADGTGHSKNGICASTEISFEAGSFTPVLVVPETEKVGIPRGFLPAAGAIYPLHVSGAESMTGKMMRLETSWKRGILAECAEQVCTSARGGHGAGHTIAAHFNWLRLEQLTAKLPNPFLLDRSRVSASILSGKFSVYDVDIFGESMVEIPVSVGVVLTGARFLPAWPGYGGFVRSDDAPLSMTVPEGTSRYFSDKGILSINSENGTPSFAFFVPYGLQD